MLPSTVERVPQHTPDSINKQIRRQTEENVSRFAGNPIATEQRLAELDREWDIERTLEANAASISLIGLALGATVDRRFFVIPGLVAGFLLQHALQGWCPPVTFFRRRGIRTASEIDEERYALKALRGDFHNVQTSQGDNSRSRTGQALHAVQS